MAGFFSLRNPGGKIPGLARSRRDLWVIGILGGIPVKATIPGGSPGGIYGGIFFLMGSRRENTRAGKIPAGSRRESGFLAGSRQDPSDCFTRVKFEIYICCGLSLILGVNVIFLCFGLW